MSGKAKGRHLITFYHWLHINTCHVFLLRTFNSLMIVLQVSHFIAYYMRWCKVCFEFGMFCVGRNLFQRISVVLVWKQTVELRRHLGYTPLLSVLSIWKPSVSGYGKDRWAVNIFWAIFSFLQVLCEEKLKCSLTTVLFTFNIWRTDLLLGITDAVHCFQLFELLGESKMDSLVHIRCIFIKQRCYTC